MLFDILIISISLSIDAFGIGISYKVKGVSFSFFSKLVIGVVSGGVMWVSLSVGGLLLRFFPPEVANILGVSILVLLGVAFVRNGLFGDQEKTYDFNQSKKIDLGEAFLLGFALSADSISAGIAAAGIGLSHIIIPITVGIMQMFFLYAGEYLIGHCKIVQKLSQKVCGVLSGCMLIVIAIIRIVSM